MNLIAGLFERVRRDQGSRPKTKMVIARLAAYQSWEIDLGESLPSSLVFCVMLLALMPNSFFANFIRLIHRKNRGSRGRPNRSSAWQNGKSAHSAELNDCTSSFSRDPLFFRNIPAHKRGGGDKGVGVDLIVISEDST